MCNVAPVRRKCDTFTGVKTGDDVLPLPQMQGQYGFLSFTTWVAEVLLTKAIVVGSGSSVSCCILHVVNTCEQRRAD